jgi:hypothetical protein
LQCLVSGDISAVYNTQFTKVPEVGDTLFSMSVKWEKSELGTIVNGVFMKVSETKASDAIIEGKAKAFNNSLTSSEKKQRSDERTAKQVERRKGANTNVLALFQSKYDTLKEKFNDVTTSDDEKVEIAKQMTTIKADATAKSLAIVE